MLKSRQRRSAPLHQKRAVSKPKNSLAWSDERKRRNDIFSELVDKYYGLPQLPVQYSAARLIKGKTSPHLLEPNEDDIPLKAHVKLGSTGTSLDTTAHAWLSTPHSLLPDDSPLRHSALVATIDGQLWDLQRPIDPVLLKDPNKPLSIEYFDFYTQRGQQTMWHSSAHILGQALELEYSNHIPLLSDGPALPEGGFFYDVYLHDKTGKPITVVDSKRKGITQRMNKIVEQKQTFDRLIVNFDEAKDIFRYNPFKIELLDKIKDIQTNTLSCHDPMNNNVTLYKCGPLIDLCRGPHVINTSQCGALTVMRHSASVLKYPTPYLYKPQNTSSIDNIPHEIASVQRIYGVSYPNQNELDIYIQQRARAEEIDHRKLGKDQHLFMFHNVSPGSPFFLPHGTRIYNKLVDFLRLEYKKRGYSEVRTPQVFDKSLWEKSGHWDNYKEDMFFVSKGKVSLDEAAASAAASVVTSNTTTTDVVTVENTPNHTHTGDDGHEHDHHHHHDTKQKRTTDIDNTTIHNHVNVHSDTALQALKPMNCPGHCVLYGTQAFSYRDLPIRYADFSNLHRNEASGALSGLTRVRCFAQDDAHIFCRVDQLQDELHNVLHFIQDVYKTFNFPVYYKLSTRPDGYIGDLDTWNHAEKILEDTLNNMNVQWEMNPGDGAFYGPKIDVTVRDALGRYHQCATMQLDFNLPKRFDLEYVDNNNTKQHPVMIHRAILGSLERFMAVLLEHTEGNLPLWLSPRQVLVTSVSPNFAEYATHIKDALILKGIYADIGDVNERIAKQVKMAQSLKYNYIVTIGAKEIETNTLTIRPRGQQKEEPEPVDIDAFIERLLYEIDTKKN